MNEIKPKLGLTIDLNALRDNYHAAQKLSAGALTACVVKADAYGLGIKQVSRALCDVGAKSFFVATAEEGAELRGALAPDKRNTAIYILNGFLAAQKNLFLSHHLRPCLASLEEINEWRELKSPKPPPALHIDTGINRLGISARDCEKITPAMIKDISPALIMSHLACADQPDNKMNQEQLTRFNVLRQKWAVAQDIPASLANTAGLFLDAAFALQMTRPGIGLYGGDPFEQPRAALPFRPVIYLTSFIAQTREIASGEGVGYGATFEAKRPMRIAIIPAGYADGYARAARGVDVYIQGRAAPLIGRIAMDMLAADITDLPPATTRRGAAVELLGAHITISAFARAAGTIAHNIATGLGRRLPRHYISDKSR